VTKEEYTEKLTGLHEKHRQENLKLDRDYALANNTVQVGDIITDHIGSIRVEQIKFTVGLSFRDFPCCVYFGIVLTKSGKPNKREKNENCSSD